MMQLLKFDPFTLSQSEKDPLFFAALQEATQWHYEHSPEYRNLCENQGFIPNSTFTLEQIPYIPVPLFKTLDLRSVPLHQMVKTLYSSSTSGKPSKIMIDAITAERQALVLQKIMVHFLGPQRRHFIIFDSESTVKSANSELSSRGTAIRGMLSLSKGFDFLLRDDLTLDANRARKFLSSIPEEMPLCFFGFTWLLYTLHQQADMRALLCELTERGKFRNAMILHIGGWKKLNDVAITKEQFNEQIGKMLNTPPTSVIDFYGMTEQLGTVYPDCPYGRKHLPLYSELLLRDPVTLQPVPDGTTGLIQLISPIPHSYPGIAVLSDDLGQIIGVDDCPCGRKGKTFVFQKRSEQAEEKGCGDTLDVKE